MGWGSLKAHAYMLQLARFGMVVSCGSLLQGQAAAVKLMPSGRCRPKREAHARSKAHMLTTCAAFKPLLSSG